ncbi:hypothetical protein PTD2_17465 [Pseudoalteromonas tunicata D2]|uniref:Uncharacterized protein n=1 Tax=Pseudoalteromonas tunicata D2 TaxID=87626 RepID=A4CB96_9GAMM|nr:hypothetical protein PTD2_17465 [Pseudoalteromonas tunicata D2]
MSPFLRIEDKIMMISYGHKYVAECNGLSTALTY